MWQVQPAFIYLKEPLVLVAEFDVHRGVEGGAVQGGQ